MAEATIFEARNYFSQMIKRASAGETITITTGKARRPVAKLVPIEEKKKLPRLGFMLTPGFELTDTFWEPMTDEESGYGGDVTRQAK